MICFAYLVDCNSSHRYHHCIAGGRPISRSIAWGKGGWVNRHHRLSVNTIFELLEDTTGGQNCRALVSQSKLLCILSSAANAIVILNSYPLGVALHRFEHSILNTLLIFIYGISIAPISKRSCKSLKIRMPLKTFYSS